MDGAQQGDSMAALRGSPGKGYQPVMDMDQVKGASVAAQLVGILFQTQIGLPGAGMEITLDGRRLDPMDRDLPDFLQLLPSTQKRMSSAVCLPSPPTT